jgi:hypothetical protein
LTALAYGRIMGTERTAVATRPLPAPNTDDGETDSGIPWPPVEQFELVWLENSPPPEGVAGNFRVVTLNEIGARPGILPKPPAPEPAETPEAEALESRAPVSPAALVAAPVSAIERFPAIDRSRFAPPDPDVNQVSVALWALTGALAALCAVGLLLLIVVAWWRWSAAPVEMAQAPAPAVADSQPPSPALPAVIPQPGSTPERPSTAPTPTPTVRDRQARAAGRAKSANVAARQSAKVPVQKHASARPAAPARHAETAKRKPSVEAAAPAPEAALTAVKPQPSAPQPTVGAQVPAARAATNAPAAAPAAPVVVPPSDEQRIREVLRSYRAAFEQFDPDALRAVWPSVDTKALGRAFDGLSSQSIVFDRCDVTVAAATARAACHGGVEYVKRVGGSGTQSARRQWDFDLQKSGDGAWRIQSLTSR